MREEFLHFIWQYQRFNSSQLFTVSGEEVKCLYPGTLNNNGGPDFSNAKIQIGDTVWAGNLEIHINSSDWYKHNHQSDRAYDNVILHVVYEHDRDTIQESNVQIPVLELKGRIPLYIKKRYSSITENIKPIPCSSIWREPPPSIQTAWLHRMAIERFQTKTEELNVFYEEQKGDWESTFYLTLAKAFGARSNQLPFLQLAQAFPLQKVKKVLSNHENQLGSCVFGVSGLLKIEEPDAFTLQLLDDFDFLEQKFQLNSMERSSWNYGRIRPYSFPDLKLAQWTSFLENHADHLYMLALNFNTEQLLRAFQSETGEYWKNHFRLAVETKKHKSSSSQDFAEKVIINAIVPLRIFYASKTGDENLLESALDLMEDLKPEVNKVVSRWRNLPLKIETGLHSQAVLHLEKEYCFNKQCLKCNFGNYLLNETS